jgi:hypothetical protein
MSWFGPPNDICGCCKCPAFNCNDGSKEVIKQITYEIQLPDPLEFWTGQGSGVSCPGVGIFGYVRNVYTGLSGLDGTYVANRSSYPECNWSLPSSSSVSVGVETYMYDHPCGSGPNTLCDSSSGNYEFALLNGNILSDILIRKVSGDGQESVLQYKRNTGNCPDFCSGTCQYEAKKRDDCEDSPFSDADYAIYYATVAFMQ